MSVKNLDGYATEIKLGEEAIRREYNSQLIYKIQDIMNLCERLN